MKLTLAILSTIIITSYAFEAKAQDKFDDQIKKILTNHYNTYREREFFSAIQSSIQIPEQPIKTYVIGNISQEPNSPPITAQTLFNIGSITKSFTAALMLIAEKEEKIDLKADFTKYLPEYSKWSGISLTQLLNMSSGLPNYSDNPTINYLFSQDLSRTWTDQQLIDLSYPQNLPQSPPLKSGYFYSNTAYILSGILLERQFNTSFKNLLEKYLLRPYKLEQTFYLVPFYSPEVKERLARGYNYNNYDSPELVGQDVTENNLSWAGAAGALVANSEDVIKWVKILFVENQLLDFEQKDKLTQMISMKTGQPLATTSADEPGGYGLGVSQRYNEKLGTFWVYQGETLGYRAIYVYFPCNKIIISTLFNSAVDDSNNKAGELIQQMYNTVLNEYPQYACGT